MLSTDEREQTRCEQNVSQVHAKCQQVRYKVTLLQFHYAIGQRPN